MSDFLFPTLPGVTWRTTWTPIFRTKVQSAVSGREYRASLMANPLYNLTLSYEFLRHGTKQELRQLVGFFLARRGAFDNFLYRLDDDCAVTDQQIGVADGVTKSFQLVRSFGSEFSEPVQNVDAVATVKVNGVAQPAGYAVSATGMVTFNVAPGAGAITWTGSYFYRARFADDQQDFDRFMKNLWEAKTVNLISSLGTRI
jgi:uncharacterized protein (TIGR02217 family)